MPTIPPEYSKEALENAQKLRQLDKAKLEMTRDQIAAASDLIDKHGTLEQAVNNINRERAKINASEAESINKLDKINQLHKELAGNQAEQAAIAKETLAIEQQKLDYLIEQAMIDGEISKEEKKQIDAQKKIVGEARKANAEFEKAAAHLKEAAKASKEMVKTFDTYLGQKGDFAAALDVDSLIGGFKSLIALTYDFDTSMKTIATGVIKSLINGIKDLAINLGDSEKAFMRATGADAKFATGLTDTYEELRGIGVSIEESNAAWTSLRGTYTDFTMDNVATRKELARTGAALQELGVSNQSFSQGVQTSTKMFGQSGTEAAATMRGLVAHAKDLQIAPEQLTAEYAQMAPQLAKLGSAGTKAFKDIAYISKITGMEMEKVLRVTEKFDTFEGAAEQAGKLNAALGGNFVNAMDLMMATDPGERFNMIRDSILDAGLSFDEMSYYQRKYYTEAAGLSSEAELAQMLSGDMGELAGDVGKTSDQLIAMQEAAQETAKFQEKLNMMFAEMIPIIRPLIEDLQAFVLWLARSAKTIIKVVGGLMQVIGVIMGLIPGVGKLSGLMVAMVGAMISVDGMATKLYNKFKAFFADALGPLADKFMEMVDAMGLLNEESKLVDGSTTDMIDSLDILFKVLSKTIQVISVPLMAFMDFMIDASKILDEFFAGTMSKMDAAGKIGSAALSAMTSMGSRLGKVLNITNMSLSGFTGGVKDLGGVLWDYAWSSNFEQGTTKLANAFEAVGTNVDQAAAPLDRIKNVFKSVGEAVFGTFKAGFNVISTFFKTLLGYVDKLMSPLTTLATTLSTVFANIFNPTTFIRMAESISSITSAIAEMPVTKAMSFTASMVAFSEAGTAFTAAAEAAPPIATPAMGATAVENTTATVIKTPQIIVQTEGGGTVPDNGPTTVSISLDGLDLRKFLEGTVVQKIGELSRQALIS